ncbi:hypothetical protein D1094_14710 [Colwellia sp. RSH04]|nr:hypothetical protein D1094_14710 [Colwellia sp. RSH04]
MQSLLQAALHITSCSTGLKQFARFLQSYAKKQSNRFSPLAKRYLATRNRVIILF